MIYAVGVVELKSIAKGVEACDAAIKSAGIRLVSAHPACPGKYEIVFTGAMAIGFFFFIVILSKEYLFTYI